MGIQRRRVARQRARGRVPCSGEPFTAWLVGVGSRQVQRSTRYARWRWGGIDRFGSDAAPGRCESRWTAAALDRAEAAGGAVFERLHEAFWGDRTVQVFDPWGHRWAFDQHVRDVTDSELEPHLASLLSGAD